MVVEKKAIVYWFQKSTIPQFFQQIANYARGDVVAFYKPHIYKILTIFGRYLVFLLYSPLFVVYLFWSVWKIYPLVSNKQALIHVPALQITSDMAVIYGAIRGLVEIHTNQSTSSDQITLSKAGLKV